MKTSAHWTEQLRTRGYALVLQHFPRETPYDALRRFGEIERLDGLNSVQTLIPRELGDASCNTYSGNFGTGQFPLHSDLAHWANPPRYFGLRCKIGCANVATRLLSSEQIITRIGMDILQRTLVQPRRPIRERRQLLRLLDVFDGGENFRFRWDSLYVRPVSNHSKEICDRVRDYLSTSTPAETYLLEPGDTLIIDNWRCVHGRSTAGTSHRHIDRAYFRSINYE